MPSSDAWTRDAIESAYAARMEPDGTTAIDTRIAAAQGVCDDDIDKIFRETEAAA
jgi:hypothetical protein